MCRAWMMVSLAASGIAGCASVRSAERAAPSSEAMVAAPRAFSLAGAKLLQSASGPAAESLLRAWGIDERMASGAGQAFVGEVEARDYPFAVRRHARAPGDGQSPGAEPARSYRVSALLLAAVFSGEDGQQRIEVFSRHRVLRDGQPAFLPMPEQGSAMEAEWVGEDPLQVIAQNGEQLYAELSLGLRAYAREVAAQ